MNRKIIRMRHVGATAKIFGNFDSNAHLIEERFSVRLYNRENESGESIVIEGEDEEMMSAANGAVADCDMTVLVAEPRFPGDIEKKIIENFKRLMAEY